MRAGWGGGGGWRALFHYYSTPSFHHGSEQYLETSRKQVALEQARQTLPGRADDGGEFDQRYPLFSREKGTHLSHKKRYRENSVPLTLPTMEPKNICNIAKTGSTSSLENLSPGLPSVAATLTKRRQGWNT